MKPLLKVGILEDNQDQLKDRKQIIEENELATVAIWATNSNDFLTTVSLLQPDALLIDIDLGNKSMSGLEVAFKLKLPVMFVSAHNAVKLKDIETLQHEYDFPVEHITKPFTDKDFIKTTKRFLNDVDVYLNSKVVYLDFKDSKRNKIPVDTIVYIESEVGASGESNNKRIYFTNRKPETLFNFSFSKMEEKGFDKTIFVQTHKSFRVNVSKFIKYNIGHTIDVNTFSDNGKQLIKEIPVSENYQKAIRKLMC